MSIDCGDGKVDQALASISLLARCSVPAASTSSGSDEVATGPCACVPVSNSDARLPDEPRVHPNRNSG